MCKEKIIFVNFIKESGDKMNLNFFEELGKAINETIEKQKVNNIDKLEDEEIELARKLDAIEQFTIDRFEENFVVLEDRKTGKMENIEKYKIPDGCNEGDILKCINGKYILDKDETIKVEKEIEDKYKNLWE